MNSYFHSTFSKSTRLHIQQSTFGKKQRTPPAYRKYAAYTIFLFSLFFFGVYSTQAEEEGHVITTDNGRIHINLGEKHGIKKGMLFDVYRPLFNIYRPKEKAKINIAQIKVTQVSFESSVASILSQEDDIEIMAGDRVKIIQPEVIDVFGLGQDEKSEDQLFPPKFKDQSNNKIHWLFFKTGIVALGSAGYFRQLADKAYINYQNANSLEKALLYRQKTKLNDNRAQIALSVSLALISIYAHLWQRDNEQMSKFP